MVCRQSTLDRGIQCNKSELAQNEKRKKLVGFSYSKSMANFEAFLWSFSSSTIPEIVRCVGAKQCGFPKLHFFSSTMQLGTWPGLWVKWMVVWINFIYFLTKLTKKKGPN